MNQAEPSMRSPLSSRGALWADERYERELAFKQQQAEGKSAAAAASGGGQSSATFDAFMRMATGKQVGGWHFTCAD